MTRTLAHDTGIRRTVDRLAAAIGNKDSAAAVALQAPGFRQFSLAPPLISTGADAAGLDAWFATWRGPIGYEVHDLDVTVAGDVAFAHGLGHMSGTKIDGTVTDLWFRTTLCLVRHGGDWKIAHEHESVPFLMDGSYRAAVDLRP